MGRSEQVFGGVIVIGIGLIWVLDYWFPGILFVVGAAILARAYSEGKDFRHEDARGGLIVIALGLVFALNLFSLFNGAWLPVVLILIGVYMLMGDRLGLTGKRKM